MSISIISANLLSIVLFLKYIQWHYEFSNHVFSPSNLVFSCFINRARNDWFWCFWYIFPTIHCCCYICSVSQRLNQNPSHTIFLKQLTQEAQLRSETKEYILMQYTALLGWARAHNSSKRRGSALLYDHPKASITAMMEKEFQHLAFGISSACEYFEKDE